jgi:iron complex transport system permease protein
VNAQRFALPLLIAALAALTLTSLAVGRYPVSISEVFSIFRLNIFSGAAEEHLSGRQREVSFLLTQIRLPRVLAAILVGAALATSGAVYQAMFANPLVSPGVLGVLSGAGAGAALGIVVFQSWLATQTLAFSFACAAVALSVLFSLLFPRSGILVLLLGGMISGAFFGALSSLLKYITDPEDQLPALVYWLMGTFSTANNDTLLRTGPLITATVVLMCVQGKSLNVLSQGDEEAGADHAHEDGSPPLHHPGKELREHDDAQQRGQGVGQSLDAIRHRPVDAGKYLDQDFGAGGAVDPLVEAAQEAHQGDIEAGAIAAQAQP